MKLAAILIDTARELLYRKTLLVYFGIVTLTLLVFAVALQTDVAGGAIASLRIFGVPGHGAPSGMTFGGEGGDAGLSADAFVRGMQLAVAFVLYPLGILLSVLATASLVPRMLEKGVIDLLLSKPVSRPALFLSRYLGGVAVATVNLVYLVGGLGLILGLKTGIWNGGFLASGLLMALYFACLLGFSVLVGLLSRSTTVSIMVVGVIYFVSLFVRLPHQNTDWPMLITSPAWRLGTQALIEALYHGLPQSYDFGQMAARLILRQGGVAWGTAFNSALSGAGALALATFLFARRDF